MISYKNIFQRTIGSQLTQTVPFKSATGLNGACVDRDTEGNVTDTEQLGNTAVQNF